jgi:monofunctional biosynthetic peptidoglycan transglycosylase
VEWAPGVYGVEAGAEHHFKRAAIQLSARQAALLAVTLPAPDKRNPARPTAALRRLSLLIERRAGHAGDYVQCAR